MKFSLKLLHCYIFLMPLTAYGQHNVYINETVGGYTRTRIVNEVDRIAFGPERMTMWSNMTSYSLDVSAVGRMSFMERDSWRGKVMPERYLADFDYDIAFEDADKERVKAETEVTDEQSKYYDDFVAHSEWTKTVNVVFNGMKATVTGDTDSITVTQEGAHLTIHTTAAGLKFVLSGQSGDASFKLYSERKACIVLNGVDLTNPQGPVINSQLKKRSFIDLAAHTVNTLTDGATYVKVQGEDQRGCIFAEGKLCLSGAGHLYVNAN